MKKLSAIIVILLLIVFTFFPKHSKQSDIEKGISIDIARTHYTKESIKKIIGELSRVNGRYLQLHLADNDNYSIYVKRLPIQITITSQKQNCVSLFNMPINTMSSLFLN